MHCVPVCLFEALTEALAGNEDSERREYVHEWEAWSQKNYTRRLNFNRYFEDSLIPLIINNSDLKLSSNMLGPKCFQSVDTTSSTQYEDSNSSW